MPAEDQKYGEEHVKGCMNRFIVTNEAASLTLSLKHAGRLQQIIIAVKLDKIMSVFNGAVIKVSRYVLLDPGRTAASSQSHQPPTRTHSRTAS
jgi:hypothetical protein